MNQDQLVEHEIEYRTLSRLAGFIETFLRSPPAAVRSIEYDHYIGDPPPMEESIITGGAICYLIDGICSSRSFKDQGCSMTVANIELDKAFKTWPKYSGIVCFPIKGCNGNPDRDMLREMWHHNRGFVGDSEYIKDRLELLSHIRDEFDKKAQEVNKKVISGLAEAIYSEMSDIMLDPVNKFPFVRTVEAPARGAAGYCYEVKCIISRVLSPIDSIRDGFRLSFLGDTFTTDIFPDWEHYSGYLIYPIIGQGYDEFHKSRGDVERMWGNNSVGQERCDLVKFCLNRTKEMI